MARTIVCRDTINCKDTIVLCNGAQNALKKQFFDTRNPKSPYHGSPPPTPTPHSVRYAPSTRGQFALSLSYLPLFFNIFPVSCLKFTTHWNISSGHPHGTERCNKSTISLWEELCSVNLIEPEINKNLQIVALWPQKLPLSIHGLCWQTLINYWYKLNLKKLKQNWFFTVYINTYMYLWNTNLTLTDFDAMWPRLMYVKATR